MPYCCLSKCLILLVGNLKHFLNLRDGKVIVWETCTKLMCYVFILSTFSLRTQGMASFLFSPSLEECFTTTILETLLSTSSISQHSTWKQHN